MQCADGKLQQWHVVSRLQFSFISGSCFCCWNNAVLWTYRAQQVTVPLVFKVSQKQVYLSFWSLRLSSTISSSWWGTSISITEVFWHDKMGFDHQTERLYFMFEMELIVKPVSSSKCTVMVVLSIFFCNLSHKNLSLELLLFKKSFMSHAGNRLAVHRTQIILDQHSDYSKQPGAVC